MANPPPVPPNLILKSKDEFIEGKIAPKDLSTPDLIKKAKELLADANPAVADERFEAVERGILVEILELQDKIDALTDRRNKAKNVARMKLDKGEVEQDYFNAEVNHQEAVYRAEGTPLEDRLREQLGVLRGDVEGEVKEESE